MQQIKEKTIKSYSCYHCGETCSDQLIRLDGKSFCCSSCSSIYKLLSDAQMDNYYRLNTAAGNKLSHEINDDQFEYLYNTEVLDDILRYKDQNRHTVLINLPAIHCSSCVWLLERLYKLVPGVISNDVDFQRKELLLSYNPNETNLATIVHFLHRIGYPVSFNKAIDRDDFSLFELYLKVAIAGFAFGNAMFLYLPDYLDSEFAGSEFKQFFIYFSLMLSLPVLLYCSSDYFKSAWASLKQKHISIDLPISIGIIALFLRSSLDIVLYDEMGYLDSFNGFIFFLLIGKLFQIKSFDHIRFKRNHQDYFPLAVLKKEADRFSYQAIKSIQTGDSILLKNGEIVPCDSKLVSDTALVDYSFVTGESDIKQFASGDRLYSGGKVHGHSIELCVEKPFNSSYITGLWSGQKQPSKQSVNYTDRLSGAFTFVVLLVALVSLVYHSDISHTDSLNRVIAILIVACPCALALSAPFTFGTVASILAKQKFYFRDTLGIEELSAIKHLIFDKTGTLNSSDDARVQLCVPEKYIPDLQSVFSQSNHPLSRSISSAIGANHQPLDSINELAGKGILASLNEQQYVIGSKEFLAEHKIAAENDIQTGSTVHIGLNGKYIGSIHVKRQLRSGIANMLEKLKQSYSLYLLSGDTDRERKEFENFFDVDKLHFSQSPFDKEDFVKNLNATKSRPVFIGDGLNDSSAITASAVGIAVSDEHAQFSPSCDAMISAQNLHFFHDYLTYIHRSKWIVYASFTLAILYNITGLTFAFNGQLTPLLSAILMPLSSVTIIVFSVSATSLIAKFSGLK